MLSLSKSTHSAQQPQAKNNKMAHNKIVFFAAFVAFLAVVQAFPGPQPGPAGPGPVGPAPVRPEAVKGEKSDLKAENSYGFGYAYGGYGGPWGGYGHPYGYSYGYPYGYAYNYPYYGGGGYYGGYPYYG